MMVYLHVHPKETDIDPVLLLEGEHRPGTVREVVQHLALVDVPGEQGVSLISKLSDSLFLFCFYGFPDVMRLGVIEPCAPV